MKKRNILSLIIGVAASLTLLTSLQAAGVEYTISSVYDVPQEGSTTVTHRVSVTNDTGDSAGDTLRLPAAGDDVGEVTATAQDDTDLRAGFDAASQTIVIDVPRSIGGANEEWSVSVSYQSDLLKEFGATKVLQVPNLQFGELNIAEESARVTADLELGFATTRGAQPDSTDIAVGKQVLVYQNESGPLNGSSLLLFGDQAVATVRVDASVKNTSWWWKTVEFALPPDTNQQQVLIESIEPRPTSVKLDADGNVVVAYRLGPKRKIQTSAQAMVQINSLTYDIGSSQTVNEIDQQLKDRYTASTDNWQPQSFEIDGEITSAVGIIRAVQSAVVEQVEEDRLQNLLDINTRSQGLKYSDMLVGELRSRGIPARVVLGKVFSDGNTLLDEPINHAWAEAYAPGVGWMTVDPVFSTGGDFFGGTDVVRVGLVLWGVSDDRPPITLDAISVSYSDREFALPELQAQIEAKKYIILPGISVLSMSVQTPPGAIVDNAALKTSGDNAISPLGSLSPLQTAQSRQLRIGASAFSQESVDYGILAGEELLVASTESSSLSFLIVFYEIGAIVVVLIVVGAVRVRRNRLNRHKTSREAVQMHEESEGESIEEEDLIVTPEPEQQLDTLPEAVDPADNIEYESALPPEPTPEEHRKDDTIKPSKPDDTHRPKPPHSNLVQ